jgi:hypothetical protein
VLGAGRASAGQTTITGYSSFGSIQAVNSRMCLELRSPHPDQVIDWAPCVAGDHLQIWEAQVIHGSMVIFLAGSTGICMDGGPHAGEYLYSYNCYQHINPTSGLLLYGQTTDGAEDSIRSTLTRLWLTSANGTGPAFWAAGRGFIRRLLAGPKATQRVVFEGGWLKVTVE